MSARPNTKLRAVDQNDDAADVRRFLASIKLLENLYGLEVHRGRAIVEWYLNVLENRFDASEPHAPLTVQDCADVLEFLSCVDSGTLATRRAVLR